MGLSSLFNFTAQAAAAFDCDDCNLGKRQTISREHGAGDYYFWDFKNRRLYHMNVKGDGSGPRALGLPVVKEIALTADEHTMFNAGVNLYYVNGGSATIAYTLPVADVAIQMMPNGRVEKAGVQAVEMFGNETPARMNAMDAVSTPHMRHEAIQKSLGYGNLGPFWYAIESTRISISSFSQAISSTLLPTPIKIINKIPFPDGSYILVTYNWNVRDYAYIPGSARDAVGNIIPDAQRDIANSEQASQNYDFPQSDAGLGAGDDMVGQLNRLGVRWVGPNTPPVHTSYRIACSYTPGGVQCQIFSLRP
ncbi:hypothetical protein C1926_04675 [Stenotrophomonas sp. ZAC14A_NAIMI4_1]|nr:hypothetical protein C1926_04675 [Stenotrophomonas sp. ZAC14A_NAIMI4_1]